MAKIKTTTVIEFSGGFLQSVRSFTNDKQGIKEAEFLFTKCIQEQGEIEMSDIEDAIETGIYTDIDGYEIYLAYSIV